MLLDPDPCFPHFRKCFKHFIQHFSLQLSGHLINIFTLETERKCLNPIKSESLDVKEEPPVKKKRQRKSKVKTEKETRDYPCDQCPYVAGRPSRLKEHIENCHQVRIYSSYVDPDPHYSWIRIQKFKMKENAEFNQQIFGGFRRKLYFSSLFFSLI